jgi:protein-tyrosine kinase
MSKIYEALLRAEQDRKEAAGKESNTTESAVSAEAVLDPRPQPDILSFVETPESSVTDDSLPLKRRVGDHHVEEIDFSAVSTTLWTPSVAQLPALEDRGRSVEQFRSLRSRMHEFRDLNTLKSILVSSGLPQEGKSFIAANLAISFARHKASRVLLIDGDMRRSSLHHILGAPSVPGLGEYLAGTATISEIMHRAEQPARGPALHHGLASLTFIGAGKDSDKAADLSGNYRFDELITTLSPHFDWIVVDSSPVNLVADGVNLARACDGVLLIARGGVTKFEVAQRALLELKSANILGFVLNAVAKPPVTGGYYGYDSYDSYDPIRE